VAQYIPKIFRKDKRKYPIRKDEWGRTARKRCFDLYDRGIRPAAVAREIGISLKTACQYHYQWKQLPKQFEDKYMFVRDRLKKNRQLREIIIKELSKETGEPEFKIKLWLESPWGIKQLTSCKWKEIIKRKKEEIEDDKRLKAALKFIELLKLCGSSYEEINDSIQRLLDEKSGKE